MVLLSFLRALADLGIYYSIAGMFAYLGGSQLALASLLLQSACFALSFALRRNRAARLAALAPALLVFVLPVFPADKLLCLPPLLYLGFLAWADNYRLSWERQKALFQIFVRAVPVAGLLFLFLKFHALFRVGLPVALLAATASVLLMRSLRHDPSVYLQPKYQLMNSAGVAALALASMVLGSEWGLQTVQYLLVTAYNEVLIPVVSGVGLAIAYVFMWAYWIAKRVHTSNDVPKFEDLLPEEDEGDVVEEAIHSSQMLARIVMVLLIAIGLFLLFRWLYRRLPKDWGSGPEPVGVRRDLSSGSAEARGPRPTVWARTYAGRIRRQYRSFLQLCQRRGVSIRPSYTSTEIGELSLAKFSDEASLNSIRDLYQEARYHGGATRADYQEFKRLLGILKKPPNRGI